MDRTEAVVKCVVEAALRGACMIYVHDQSQGSHDFDLAFADGRNAILEVTRSTRGDLKALTAQVMGPRYGGPFVPVSNCKSGWYIHLDPRANPREIHRNIDAYLSRIEEEGRISFSAFTDSHDSPAVLRIWQDLGVEAGSIIEWKDGPMIGLSTPGVGGSPSPQEVSRVVMELASRPDNLRKLTTDRHCESHIAVVVEWYNYVAWAAVNDMAPDQQVLTIDPRVSHAWAIANTRNPEEYVAWHSRVGEAWKRLGLFIVTESEVSSLSTR